MDVSCAIYHIIESTFVDTSNNRLMRFLFHPCVCCDCPRDGFLVLLTFTCFRKFEFKVALKARVRNHNKNKPFKCDICG